MVREKARRAVKYTADLALVHGSVFTGNPHQRRAQAVAIRGNRVIAVGSDEGVQSLVGKSTRVVDLAGRFVCPGFNDAHMHLLGGGLALSRVELRGVTTFEELRRRIEAAVEGMAPEAWVEGRGWDQELLPDGAWPDLALIDEAAGGRPAFLYRIDGHTAWASSSALAQARIGPHTPNPPGGEIVRTSTGSPTGILKESAAGLVERIIPKPGPSQHRAAVLAALAELRRQGITSVSEFSPAEAIRVYAELLQEQRLTARINAWGSLTEDLEATESIRERLAPENAFLRLTTLKGYLDGTLGARTAALGEPYADAAQERGLAQLGEDHLRRLVRKAHRMGFQVALHAIGDHAVAMALDAFEHVGPEGKMRRHRIEHAELAAPDDIPRFVASGAVASMQPAQLISDLPWLVARLGVERAGRAFPWRRLIDSGANVIFGSDWPIEPMNPMLGMFAATARLEAEGLPSLGMRAEAQLDPEEALLAYTYGPAWATFEESVKGSLVAGHLADVTILSADPTHVPADEIPSIEVEFTICDGKVVYSREGVEGPPDA